jgi:hypothetical protein
LELIVSDEPDSINKVPFTIPSSSQTVAEEIVSSESPLGAVAKVKGIAEKVATNRIIVANIAWRM